MFDSDGTSCMSNGVLKSTLWKVGINLCGRGGADV